MSARDIKWLAAVAFAALLLANGRAGVSDTAPLSESDDVQGVETAVLTQAPNVPPPITRKHPAKVIVNLEVREVIKNLADGVQYSFWTFGGDVPGRFIRIREGDEVEFHLNNNQNNKMPHNIDLHAVTGPGGGAASSFTAPGHSSQFSFKALNPGLYVYHCATAPVGMHIGNGMYGLILVEPKEGLPPVDREYYVMQGEFYTMGKFGEGGLQPFDPDKALDERPPYVVFNGSVGALTGDNALTAKVGETVRIYFGNGGPNLSSSFHVIGDQFDTLYPDGTLTNLLHDVQTTLVPPGSAVIVDFKVKVPGAYTLVDHAIFRAFSKGAVGTLNVSGPPDQVVYSGKQSDTLYVGEPVTNVLITMPELPLTETEEGSVSPALRAKYALGKQVFMQTCFLCHQPDGQGVPGQIPPLAKSDFLAKLTKDDYIHGVLTGRTGKIVVNGKPFNSIMVPLNYLSDDQVANVLTYVRNNFGNSGDAVTPEDVARVRQQLAPPPAKSEFE